MSEIPMPESDGYEAPTPTEAKSSNTMKIVAIVIVVVVVIAGIVVVVLFNPFAPSTPYQSRTVYDDSGDISLYPTFYRSEFSVSSSETTTDTAPDLLFQISVLSTGSDSVDVVVYYEVYDITQSSFDSLSWAELVPYLVDDGFATNSVNNFVNLNNFADTYVWVFYFTATAKTTTWNIDATLTLRYNWDL
jgi:hypothetical protein